jgi:hypothetical protein
MWKPPLHGIKRTRAHGGRERFRYWSPSATVWRESLPSFNGEGGGAGEKSRRCRPEKPHGSARAEKTPRFENNQIAINR